jgi:hypothetical protein
MEQSLSYKIEHCGGGNEKGNEEDEYDQSTLYAWMKMSYCNPLVCKVNLQQQRENKNIL